LLIGTGEPLDFLGEAAPAHVALDAQRACDGESVLERRLLELPQAPQCACAVLGEGSSIKSRDLRGAIVLCHAFLGGFTHTQNIA
jgi:hypothetical protein